MASGSNKQRLNTRLSTIAELVAVDDFLSKLLWVQKFLEDLGYPLRQNILLQDNTSTILMEKSGGSCLGVRNWAIGVRYFAIKDVIDKGEVQIQHCPTQNMAGDFFTKPLQGRKFLDLENSFLVCN